MVTSKWPKDKHLFTEIYQGDDYISCTQITCKPHADSPTQTTIAVTCGLSSSTLSHPKSLQGESQASHFLLLSSLIHRVFSSLVRSPPFL